MTRRSGRRSWRWWRRSESGSGRPGLRRPGGRLLAIPVDHREAPPELLAAARVERRHPFDPAAVVGIEAEVDQDAYDFTGGGKFGSKTNVHTKNDADHSLPYLLAVAGLDGDVQTAQLDARRIDKPDVQALLRKVKVKPDDAFTARYPGQVPARVTVRLEGGKSYNQEVKDYLGFPTRPFSWDESVEKFDKLVAGHADKGPCREIKDAVRSLENIQVKELMKLLGQVT